MVRIGTRRPAICCPFQPSPQLFSSPSPSKVPLVEAFAVRLPSVARSTQVCIEWLWKHSLLLSTYIVKNDIYLPVRSPYLGVISFSWLYTAEPVTSRRIATETRPTRNT
jgi:hypothetical protein